MPTSFFAVLLYTFTHISTTLSASPSDWKSRSIYQLLTDRFAKTTDTTLACGDLAKYQGGTFQGIINHYSYIQDLGFDAIWISPIVENVPWPNGDMEGYHGYWAYNIYQINSHFGTEQDLLNLANTLHSANDSYLMIDVVANHMGQPQNGDYQNGFSSFVPFNQSSYYHNCDSCPPGCNANNYTCNANYTSLQSQICRLEGLPDLNQSVPFVNTSLLQWIHEYVVDKWKADGIRIDTVQEVNQQFWSQFQQSAGVYAVGEVDNGDSGCVGKYQKSGLDATLNYPMFYPIRRVFGEGNGFSDLSYQINKNRNDFADTTVLGNFVDNHDNDRFLCKYPAANSLYHRKYINALTFVLTFEGIPIIYYGTEQAFNGCMEQANDGSGSRECLWPNCGDYNVSRTDIGRALSVINNARKQGEIWNYQFVELKTNDSNHFYAFTRGDSFLVLLTNVGYQSGNISYEIYNSGIKMNVKYCNIFWPKVDCITYNGGGTLKVNLFQGESKIYVPESEIINKYPKEYHITKIDLI